MGDSTSDPCPGSPGEGWDDFGMEEWTEVAHRGGRKGNYLPELQGQRAPAEEVVHTVADADDLAAVASSAQASVRLVDLGGRVQTSTVRMKEFSGLHPDRLLAVRRSTSYVGQRNYVSTVVAPSDQSGHRTVWVESFNERAHAHDILVCHDVTQLVTQMCRFEWVFPSGGLRTHVPDFLYRRRDGQMVMVDVSVGERLEKDPLVLAVFMLTRATCRLMGWGFELRLEMPRQRVRNVQFIASYRNSDALRGDQWIATAETVTAPTPAYSVAERLGAFSNRSDGHALWWVMSRGLLHADFSEPLRPDSTVYPGRAGTPDQAWVFNA